MQKMCFSNNPYIDKVFTEDVRGAHRGLMGIFALAGEIRKEKIDTAIVVFPFFRNALSVFIAGIPLRISTGFRWYQYLFNRLTYLNRSKALKHEIDYAMDLAEMAGAEPLKEYPELFPADDDNKYAEEFFSANDIIKGKDIVVGINPGSGLSARKWPEKNYVDLSRLLIKRYGAKIIIFWGPGEEEMAERMKKDIGAGCHVSCKTNILQLAALVSQCSLFVTNNTGPMHIAASTDMPMIAIFDPKKACAPERWGYRDEKRIVLKPEIKCEDSCKRMKCGYGECMELITVEMVLNSAQKLLQLENRNQQRKKENA